jgi:signal peptidase I
MMPRLFISVAAGVAVFGLLAAFAQRRLVLVTVRGWSMAPTLDHGDRLLARRARGAAVRPGQIVVIELPPGEADRPGQPGEADANGTYLIKRCSAAAGDPLPANLPRRFRTGDGRVPSGMLTVSSDNRANRNDSRRYGPIAHERVLCVAVRSAPPAMPSSAARRQAVDDDTERV